MNGIKNFVAYLLIVYAATLSGQTPAQLLELRAFESARYTALIDKNFSATEKMVADDLVYTHSNTTVEDKAAYLAALRNGKYDFKQFATDSTQYKVINKKTIVAAGNVEMQLLYQGKDIKLSGRFTAVYVKRHHRWQLLAWQTTKRP